MQIFTYKDMSVSNVSPNFPMFYENRHISTQISRLCHVHTQVHTLKVMSSHTFCLMEMFPSTVWHLVFHHFDRCEGTINAMFTLKTLLGHVYVQLLTYEDVFVCISLTWSPRLHSNVQLKTRWHIRVHVFLNTNPNPSFHRFVWKDITFTMKTHHSLFAASRATRSRKTKHTHKHYS